MAREDSLLREAIATRAERGRNRGSIREDRTSLQPESIGSSDVRDQGLFTEQTGVLLTGYGTTETMHT